MMEGDYQSQQNSLPELNLDPNSMIEDFASFLDNDSISSCSSASTLPLGGREGVSSASSMLLTEEGEGLGGVVDHHHHHDEVCEEGSVSPPQDNFKADGLSTESHDVGWTDRGGGGRIRSYTVDHSTIKCLNLSHTSSSSSSMDHGSWGRGSDCSSYSDRTLGSPSSLYMRPLYEDSTDGDSAMRSRSMSMGAPMATRHRKVGIDTNAYSRISVYSLRSAFEYLDQQGSDGWL